MIKFNKKNLILSISISLIVIIISTILFIINKEQSNLISYSNNKKEIKINLFNKNNTKGTNSINLSEDDPKNFILNKKIDENSDIIFTYNKEYKKTIISVIQDDVFINNNIISDHNIIIKEIKSEIGDVLLFNNNSLEITENLKSVFKLKDILNNIELNKKNVENTNKNILEDFNYSFENGLWNKTIDVCEKINNNESILSQSIINNCSDGKKCLKISSKNNTGCVSSLFTIELKSNSSYNFSFDYKDLVKDSKASILITMFSDNGQMAHFTSSLSPKNSFRTFSYDFNLKDNVVGFMIKLNITGENGKESSVVFDNLRIKELDKNQIIEIKKEEAVKEYQINNISLKTGLSEFRAISKNDSELSDNIYDYFLTFENKYQSSSFIKKIENQNIILRLSIFIIFISSAYFAFALIVLFKEQIIFAIKKTINYVFNSIKKFIISVFDYIKHKYTEIKNEKAIFKIIKVILILSIFAYYVIYNIKKDNPIDVRSALALFYGLNSVLFVLESRISAFVALVYLILCPFLLIYKKDSLAELMAIQAYYFLVITVITQIRELKKENKEEK